MNKKTRIYNFSQPKFLDLVVDQELKERFEIVENSGLTAAEVLEQKIDVIEISPNDFEEFRPFVAAVDWKTSQLGMADVILRNGEIYRAANLLPLTVIDLIKKTRYGFNSQQQVIVVGDFHFVYSMAIQLALSGFIEIVISITEDEETYTELALQKIKSFVFNLNITAVNVNELTTSDLLGALLVSNFKKASNKEAYELLTYFNFLSQGAVLIDCNSIIDPSLVEDARKAEIAVIDETEVITHKYKYLLEVLKISP